MKLALLVAAVLGSTFAGPGDRLILSAQGCANTIVCENQLPGNTGWDISGVGDPTIQGFATDISVNHGTTVHFKIKTTAGAYRLDIYRMGYYGGNGARMVATMGPSAVLPQNQPACLSDVTTGLVDCGNWAESAAWPVPTNATSGIYFAKLTRTDTGGASHIFFIVRSDTSQSKVLFKTSDTTWQAYNSYGGNSLYAGDPDGRAYKVSYNRPFNDRGNGSGPTGSWVFSSEYPMVRWLEANGYDLSYMAGIDLERHSALISNHKVLLSVGHDEYWSGLQRSNVEAARNAGVHLAFFSGNEMFWKIRWENSIDGSGTPSRTIVCYKETHANSPIDPADPTIWTGTWRDPRFSPPADGGRPENALTGTIFMVNGPVSNSIAVPAQNGLFRFWRNTSVNSLAPGTIATMPQGTLGYEWDEELDNGFRPPGLMRLSSTTVQVPSLLLDYGTSYGSGTATHNVTLYRHSSGALVFGAGTVQWSWGLDGNHDSTGTATDSNMQQATVNLFADMGVQPATLQPGMVPASISSDTTAPQSAIAAPTGGATIPINNTIVVSGTAADAGGGRVAGVEVSVDSGATWHPANGFQNWSYAWVPIATGFVTILSRAVDDSGNLETPTTGPTVDVVPDTTPPVISNLLVTAATGTWATITWTTSAPADSQVEYGVTTGYGSATLLDTTLMTNHSVFVGGLALTTTYHFRVKSRNVSGTLGVSGDFTFTTTSTTATQTVTFDDLTGQDRGLNGQYPTGVIDWGTNVWWLSSPWGAFTTKSFSFNGASIFSASFTFLQSLRLVALDAYNGDTASTTVTVACVGQTTRQVTLTAGKVSTIATGWTGPCSGVTISSSNGWSTNFDNLIIDSPPPDTTPPVISAVQATGLTASGATVTWTTNKASNSQVEYGTSTAYGTLSTLDTTVVTSHSVTLSGLTGSTLYHYRVRSSGPFGNQAVSGDFVFTTPLARTTPPIVTLLQAVATNDRASITWTTDEVADSQVEYGTSTAYGTLTTLDPTLVTGHAVALNGLTAGTTYHYRVRSRDGSNNLAITGDFTFTTSLIAPAGLWTDATQPATPAWPDSAAVELGLKFQADVNGYIAGIRFYKGSTNTGTHVGKLWTATGTLLATATFTNETAAGWQQVSFGTPVAVAANTTYVVSYHTNTGNYSLNQNYFESVGFDNAPLHALASGVSAGNGMYLYGSGGFPVQSYLGSNYWVDVMFVDTTPPAITIVQATGVTTSGATVTWTTNKASNSQVEYGTSTAYGTLSTLNTTMVTGHGVTLSGLTGGTVYHYRARSSDASGNQATSGDFTFTTLVPRTTPPVVTAVQAIAVSSDAASITWTTDEAADSQVEYGTSTAYGTLTTLDPTLVTSHGVALNGLTAGTTYHYRVWSRDASNNQAITGDFTFTTSLIASVSLWTNATQPAAAAWPDSAALELGLKFQTDVSGYITGVRFYKGSTNTGTHVGKLWSATGALLATATFTNETATGWQQVSFGTPVAVAANTTYVVSYHTNTGNYAVNQNYFESVGLDNAPLHALASGVSAGNGMYLYGPGGFPSQTYIASNYWVDVVFLR